MHQIKAAAPAKPAQPPVGIESDALGSPPMQALRVERDNELLRITLARPERRNAFDAQLIRELTEAFGSVGDDVRVVLLAGDGPSFCAGADVEWQRASIDLTLDENVEDALRLHAMLAAVDGCPAPLVVRIQGYALGGGSGLVACADVAVAGADATFGFSEARLGIIPAVISPFVFARIGAGASRPLFVTGERFDAPTALRIGLVDEVTDDLDAAVDRHVAAILKCGPRATRAAKQLTRERPSDASELARIAAGLRAGDEGQEGLRAFLDKRPPSWTG
jgi:methylglutaconyl-CoA hydratase